MSNNRPAIITVHQLCLSVVNSISNDFLNGKQSVHLVPGNLEMMLGVEFGSFAELVMKGMLHGVSDHFITMPDSESVSRWIEKAATQATLPEAMAAFISNCRHRRALNKIRAEELLSLTTRLTECRKILVELQSTKDKLTSLTGQADTTQVSLLELHAALDNTLKRTMEKRDAYQGEYTVIQRELGIPH